VIIWGKGGQKDEDGDKNKKAKKMYIYYYCWFHDLILDPTFFTSIITKLYFPVKGYIKKERKTEW